MGEINVGIMTDKERDAAVIPPQ